MVERLPCVRCMGSISYCSVKCKKEDYPDHFLPCKVALSKLLAGRGAEIHNRRQRQMQKKGGFDRLAQNLVANLAPAQVKEELYFVRLPYNPEQKMQRDHPIKHISRRDAALEMTRTAVMLKAYKSYMDHFLRHRDTTHLYMFVHPPDLSFCAMVVVPYAPDKTYDSSAHAESDTSICPCPIHTQQ